MRRAHPPAAPQAGSVRPVRPADSASLVIVLLVEQCRHSAMGTPYPPAWAESSTGNLEATAPKLANRDQVLQLISKLQAVAAACRSTYQALGQLSTLTEWGSQRHSQELNTATNRLYDVVGCVMVQIDEPMDFVDDGESDRMLALREYHRLGSGSAPGPGHNALDLQHCLQAAAEDAANLREPTSPANGSPPVEPANTGIVSEHSEAQPAEAAGEGGNRKVEEKSVADEEAPDYGGDDPLEVFGSDTHEQAPEPELGSEAQEKRKSVAVTLSLIHI